MKNFWFCNLLLSLFCFNNLFATGIFIVEDKIPYQYLATAQIEVDNHKDNFVDVSFLWWQFSADDSLYARFQNSAYNEYASLVRYAKPIPRSTPGFKISVGKGVNNNKWEIGAEYTRIVGKVKAGTYLPYQMSIIPYYSYINGNIVAMGCSEAHTLGRHYYNVLDLLTKYPCYLGRKLIISTFLGIRGSKIYSFQRNLYYDVDLDYYDGEIAEGNPVTYETIENIERYKLRESFKSYYVGIIQGMEVQFILVDKLRLEGKLGLSLLTGKTKTKLYSQFSQEIMGESEQTTNYQQIWYIRPVYETAIGLGFGKYFNRDMYHLDASLLFESNYWGNFFTDDRPANLWAYGITFKVRFDF